MVTLVRNHGRQDAELVGLVARARAGSTAAFDALATRVRAQVVAWARTVTHDADDADDVAQLVLLRLYRHVDRFDGRSRFSTWLYSVTRNVAFNVLARERRRERLRSEHIRLEPPGEAVSEIGGEQASLVDAVHALLDELPPRQRRVFELCDLEGLKSSEVAERLGITPATVRGSLMKARRRIRVRLLERHASLLEDYTP